MMNGIEKEIVNQAMLSVMKMFDIEMRYSAKAKSAKDLFDGELLIGDTRFACDVKQRVTDYNLNTVISECVRIRNSYGLPVLLLANDISSKLMEALHYNGIHTMDAAGNCYIKHNGLMMFCHGRKNCNLVQKEALSFKEPGLKVLYFILTDLTKVNLPFREIQSQTGVGLATINKLFSSLKQNGYLFSSKKGRHLKNTTGLLSVFVDNYCRVMKPKGLMTTMRFLPEARVRWNETALPTGMEWGGEPGAFLKDGYLMPEVFDVYSTVSTTQLITSKVAVPAKDGEIRVYRKFWMDEEDKKIAPAIIIYADLMGSGDSRCIEAAQRIFDHELSYLR